MSDELMSLPKGWETTTLEKIVLSISYGHTASSTEVLVGPKFLRITDLQNNSVNWDKVPYCECDSVEKYKLKQGDIVVARTGATTGKSFLIQDLPEPTVFASYLIRLQTSTSCAPEYLAAFMQSDNYWKQITTVSKGTAQPGANASILGTLSIPLPPLNEQKRIVAAIEALRERSQKARSALSVIPELCDKFRQSVLAAAFRGDLTADWREQNSDVEPASVLLERIRRDRRKQWEKFEIERLKARGKILADSKWKEKYEEPKSVRELDLLDIPPTWCWAKWEQVGLCQNGRAFPSKEYQAEGVKLLRPGNLYISGKVEWNESNTKFMSEAWATEYPDYLVGSNELVINLTAQSLADEFLGRVCLTGENEICLLNQRIARLTPVGISTQFLLWLFKSRLFRHYVDDLNTGSLIQHMFTSQIDEFYFPLPPLEEQEAIVQEIEVRIKSVESMKRSAKEIFEIIPGLDRSTLAKAFRGELVEQDPNDEPASVLLKRIRVDREQQAQGKAKKLGKKAAGNKL